MAGSGRLVDYLGGGLIANRPVSLTLVAGAIGLWWATDTSTLSVWDDGAWADVAGGTGMTNPMTTAQDLIVGGASGAPARLPIITDGQVLGAVSGAWAGVPLSGGGDMLAATYDPAGIAEQVVGETAAQTLTNKDLSDASNTFPADLAKKDAANAFTQQQAVTPYRANITGAVSIDLAATAKSNTLILTLTGNVTSFALTNPVDGANYEIWFLQDATGGHTMPALPSAMKFSGGTAPTWTTTPSALDLLCLSYGATEGIYMAAFSPNMS